MFSKTKCEGLLPDAEFQFHETISVSPDLNAEVIPPGDWRSGSCVFSDSFGPCNAIYALLDNEKAAIFHATFSTKTSPDFIKFVENVKGHVKELIVFQKPTNISNQNKAAALAIELMLALELNEVRRINIPEGYRCIVAISQPKLRRIILANEINLDEKKIDASTSIKRVIDIYDPINCNASTYLI